MKQRYNFIDNLRWVTVVLVLIYHVFYNFNALGVFGGIGGFAGQQWQDVVGTVLYPWFMTLMFILAGVSGRYALRHRTEREFRRERARKLLVPSTLGLFVFGWVLGFVNMKAGGGVLPEGVPVVVKFLIGVISGTGPLWFIQDLFVFSLLLLVVCRVLNADRVEEWLARLSGQSLSLVVFAIFPLLWLVAQTQIDNAGAFSGLLNLYRPVYYFVVFLVGYYVFASERVHGYLARCSNMLCVAAVVTGVVFCVKFYGEDYTSPAALQSVWCSLYCSSATLALIGLFKRRYDCTTPFSRYMTRSSYGLYIVHMTVCTSACLWLKSTELPVWSIYCLALIATFAGSIVLWEVMRRIPVVRWCVFGIKGETHPNPPCEGGNSGSAINCQMTKNLFGFISSLVERYF